MTIPRLSKINGQRIIALGEEAYYLRAELTSRGWTFQIDDMRYPKGPLCTFKIKLDTAEKLLTSRLAKPIRKAFQRIFYDEADQKINETINLLQTYATEFEADEPEPEYKPHKTSKAERLVSLALEQQIELFRDQFGTPFVRFPVPKCEASEAVKLNSLLNTPNHNKIYDIQNRVGDINKENSFTDALASHLEVVWQVWPLESKVFREWLAGLLWKYDEDVAKREHVQSAIMVLAAMAHEKQVVTLWNRVAPDGEGGLWIDLCNDLWEAVHVTGDGWEVTQQPLLFRRYPHQLPLCYPSSCPDLAKLFKYVNVGNVGDVERHVNSQLLYLVALITAFVPGIPHVGVILYGGAGKVKTMTQVLTRKLIDPSSVVYNAVPRGKLTSLIQILDQHYYTVFDNLGSIDDEVSDVFCRAITGAAFQLRRLFTDDEVYLRAFKRVVNMNGINVPGENPDLLDRMLVFEAMYVPMSRRRSETEVMREFEADAPDILAGILDVLVKAVKLYPGVKVDRLPRMADFTLWGCAVCEALGVPYTKFLNAYYQNQLDVKGDVVKSRMVGQLLLDFLSSRLSERSPSFTVTVADLFYQLVEFAKQGNIDVRKLPPDPTRLGRELNIIAENLPSLGYSMTKKKTRRGVAISFSLLKNTTLDAVLEERPESYRNVWDVTDFTQILRKTVEPKAEEEAKEAGISERIDVLFGYIFDKGKNSVSEGELMKEFGVDRSRLRELLKPLLRSDMVREVRPGWFIAVRLDEEDEI